MAANTAQRVDVERLTELLAKATPGPWAVTIGGHVKQVGGRVIVMAKELRCEQTDNDAELIAAARDALPALLLQVAEQAAEIAAERRLSASISRQCNECANQRNDALNKLVAAERAREEACEEVDRLNAIINTPQADDFLRAVSTEAEHQRQRWGNDHDAGKTPADWFWLIGYLAGKALHANAAGDVTKAEHHVITTAAACANWHKAMRGETNMRPGIDPAAFLAAKG